VSGPTPPGPLPPEVPEEFAAAYRAAYQRALEAQTDGSTHRAAPEPEPQVVENADEELPQRQGRLVVGTHRTEVYDDDSTAFERLTDSPWFVPVLLTLLALLLILGAYAVGRAFSGKVKDDAGSGSATAVVMTTRL
jgi:hypothetical protein